MIGFHMQGGIPGWLEALEMLPAGTWCKSVDDLHMCRDMKARNPGVMTVFRKHTKQQTPSTDYQENKRIAREYFKTFVDGTFWQQELYRWIDGIEEWNEYLANSQSPAEKAMWLSWCRAVNDVWLNEYVLPNESELGHIRLVSCNTAIGNDIPPEFARVVMDHNGILSYHNYTAVNNGKIWAEDWEWLSGRFAKMDDIYRSKGIYVDWISTEGGCVHQFDPNSSSLDPNGGWKHKYTYQGDLDAYIDGVIRYQLERTTAWNADHGGRFLGSQLFTSALPGGVWHSFILDGPQLQKVAEFVLNWSEPVQPPSDLEDYLWDVSVQEQIRQGIRLNPNAGLQQLIFESCCPGCYVPVINETPAHYAGEDYIVQAAESLDGSTPKRLCYVYELATQATWKFTKET